MPLHERDRRSILPTYSRLPVTIARGESVFLYTEEDEQYLDFTAGLGVNALGYAHPDVLDAVNRQMQTYAHLSNAYVQESQVELAERLLERSPGFGGVFFCNSGAEAIEAAVKLARKWGRSREKTTLTGFTKGFHGRTTGALSLMATEKYREGFEPLLDGCVHLSYNDIDALQAGVTEHTAAVFLEFLQGEGGIIPADKEFVAALKELREQYGFLIVADEIQAGVGRTGKFYSYEWYDIVPDVICIAKAIGGGLPLGAMIVREELRDVYGLGRHGSTFGGNPVACAAGTVVFDKVTMGGLMEHVQYTSALMFEGLLLLQDRHPDVIAHIRGRGFMIGVELRFTDADIQERFRKRGILVNVTQQNVIRLLPPLILEKNEALRFIGALSEIVAELNIQLR